MARKSQRKGKTIRVGVVGGRRGRSFMGDAAQAAGTELVAVCEQSANVIKDLKQRLDMPDHVAVYADYDTFLEHDMDAVVLANYFHEHAPFAVKALTAGFHVMSETAACHTMAEGVELVRTVEKTGKIYLFAENYAYMRHNQEMRRVFQAGRLGSFMYGEAEYVHPMNADVSNALSPGLNHWRNWIPATYYCTHAMAPIMAITDTWPAKVNGFVIRRAPDDPVTARTVKRNDAASMIAVRMDNHAVVKLLQVKLMGAHNIATRIHAARGSMYGKGSHVTLMRPQYHERRRFSPEITYVPDFPEMHAMAMKAGHGGGDFFMNWHFADAIRKGEQPYLDVYRGVAMSVVGIQAYRSALADSAPMEIPDFHKESARRKYAKDDWSPDPERRKKGQPWPSVEGNKKPSKQAVAYARKIWRKSGFKGL